MHYWNTYFFAKFALFFGHTIKFNWQLNLLFALTQSINFSQKRWRIAQQLIAIPTAIALLYYESNLPPFSRVISQAGALSDFSADYMLELLGRFVDFRSVAMLAALLVFYILLAKRVRFTSFVFLGILCIPLISKLTSGGDSAQTAGAALSAGTQPASGDAAVNNAGTQDPAAMLDAFYAEEKTRLLSFPAVGAAKLPFDVVLLHVCSLSWDDLDFIGEHHPALFNRFDVVFRNFNSAASYSGPAAMRLLRSSCGQQKHADLYEPTQDQCFLFKNFTQAGYETTALMNHDGHYGQFAKGLMSTGGLDATPQEGKWGEVAMHSFDGTPIYGDFSVLSKWWSEHRTKASAGSAESGKPLALYYNTITLHDGNKLAGVKSSSSLQTYKPRLNKLLSDFDRFVSQLESAGRPVVVILMPEHGAALRGDQLQISGMREIPNPKVTLVPVAIKLIGLKNKDSDSKTPLLVDKPISYNGVFNLLADLMNDSPYQQASRPLAERLQSVADTQFVSENEKIVVMKKQNNYVMRSPEGTWINYDSN